MNFLMICVLLMVIFNFAALSIFGYIAAILYAIYLIYQIVDIIYHKYIKRDYWFILYFFSKFY